jgi:hypothetical protein
VTLRVRMTRRITVQDRRRHASRLRDLVLGVIEWHLPPDQYEALRAAEGSERQLVNGLVGLAPQRGPA